VKKIVSQQEASHQLHKPKKKGSHA